MRSDGERKLKSLTANNVGAYCKTTIELLLTASHLLHAAHNQHNMLLNNPGKFT